MAARADPTAVERVDVEPGGHRVRQSEQRVFDGQPIVNPVAIGREGHGRDLQVSDQAVTCRQRRQEDDVGAPLDRLYRTVRATRIYEGTTEIQQLIVAKAVLA